MSYLNRTNFTLFFAYCLLSFQVYDLQIYNYLPNTPNYHDFFDYPNWAYYPKFVPRNRKNVIKGCVYLADWFEGIDLICRLFVLLVGNSLPNNHSIATKQKSIGRMLSPNASKVFWIMNYFTSSKSVSVTSPSWLFLLSFDVD